MTDSTMIEALIFSILSLLLGVLRLSEESLRRIRKPLLKSREELGDESARIALELSETPAQVEMAVRILSTFILVLIGVDLGIYLARESDQELSALGWVGESGFFFVYLGIAVLASTYILFVGEIIPKYLASAYPEGIARVLSPNLKKSTEILSPFIRGLDWTGRKLFQSFGVECDTSEIVTEEEVKEMIREGTDLGVFEQVEEQMVNKVLKLGDKTAASLMTPRNETVWLDASKNPKELLNEAYESGHSNFVVARESLDSILGFTSIADLSRFVMTDKGNESIGDIVREPLILGNHLSGLKVLEQMREAKRHIALVVDEYGGLDGIITTHDLIEAVVGELQDENEEEASITYRSDNSFLVDAAFDVDEIMEKLELNPLHVEEKKGYHSLGGFILSQLGHIPKAGEVVEYEGHILEVVDMDRNRIDKILVRKKA